MLSISADTAATSLKETTMAEEQWEKYAESDEDADDDVSSL